MTYINRKYQNKLKDLASQFPCLVVTGARQVGKSTLLRRLFPDHKVVSLDLPSLAEQAEEDPDFFLRQNPGPLIIDEVQYAPKIFRHLKRVIDSDRHRMGHFILTGSQKFVLMKEVSDSLAGRAAIVNMENLALVELLDAGFAGDDISYLSRGFYPELWRNPDLDMRAFYESYLATYLERDVRQILNVQSLRDFERFIRACGSRSGQLLNMSDLARDVGIKPQTAKDWISVLEASNQVSLLEPFFENVGKRLAKSPKLYINDPGFLCYLLALDSQSLPLSPLVGNIWETYVYSEFRKSIGHGSKVRTLWYFRDSQAKEIDFIHVSQGRVDLIECKWSENPADRWVDQMTEIGNTIAKNKTYRMGDKIILCRIANVVTRNGARIMSPKEYFQSAV